MPSPGSGARHVILAFLLLVTGGAWRSMPGGRRRSSRTGLYQPISREGALILNNLLLCTLAATVLLGTLYPLFLDLLTGAKVRSARRSSTPPSCL